MIEYKKANEENIDDIIDLRIIYLIEYNTFLEERVIALLRKNMKEYLIKYLNRECFVYVAYDGEKIVSSVIVNIFEKVPSPRFINCRYGEMYGVYTRVEYRKRGIATELVKMMIHEMSDKDISFVQLGASEDGKNIYLKNGFQYTNSEYVEMKYYYN